MGMNICRFSSSLGRKGARSSSGGLTSVPSGRRLALLLGSQTWRVSVKISTNTGPYWASAASTAAFISALLWAQA